MFAQRARRKQRKRKMTQICLGWSIYSHFLNLLFTIFVLLFLQVISQDKKFKTKLIYLKGQLALGQSAEKFGPPAKHQAPSSCSWYWLSEPISVDFRTHFGVETTLTIQWDDLYEKMSVFLLILLDLSVYSDTTHHSTLEWTIFQFLILFTLSQRFHLASQAQHFWIHCGLTTLTFEKTQTTTTPYRQEE